MSLLLIEVVPQGMVFGADKNITDETEATFPNGETKVFNHGQYQGRKTFLSSNRKVLVGYVGRSNIGDTSTDEWLSKFMEENADFTNWEVLAEMLRLQVEEQLKGGNSKPRDLHIQIAGFEEKEGVQVPTIWHIRNLHDRDESGVVYSHGRMDTTNTFICTELFRNRHSDIYPHGIRKMIEIEAARYDPYWIHQGIGLDIFNTIEFHIKAAFRVLCQVHPDHYLPQTLSDWRNQVKMSIWAYIAYFKAYKGPKEQFVGGDVDTVSLAWPS